MNLTRRQLLAGCATGSLVRAQSRVGNAMRRRPTPAVCLYSRALADIGYLDLPLILQTLGFDGVDLSVQRGGQVDPSKAGNFLMPALEAFTGAGLDAPMITTDLTSAQDRDAENVLGLASYIGVPFFRPGHWRFTGSVAVEMELATVQRDVAGLAALGRATGLAMGVHNYLDGAEGAAIKDIGRVIQPIDARWVGYDFDVGWAAVEGGAAGFDAPLALAMPRLKMVTVRDLKWEKDAAGVRTATQCAPGDGVVDWPKFFSALAKARFAGPMTLPIDYQPKDRLAAVKRDLAFVRKQIAAAYEAVR